MYLTKPRVPSTLPRSAPPQTLPTCLEPKMIFSTPEEMELLSEMGKNLIAQRLCHLPNLQDIRPSTILPKYAEFLKTKSEVLPLQLLPFSENKGSDAVSILNFFAVSFQDSFI